MSRSLRWGLLSTARINRSLIPPLQSAPRSQLVAVASRSLDQAKVYAADWNIPKAYGSYDELLADPEIDVIYNPLPNSLHAEWTIKAARAGKHVLCEKPLTCDLAEVDAMIQAAQENKVAVVEAYMYRHHPQVLQVQEMVRAGQLGPLRVLRGNFSTTLSRPNDVRWDPALGGGSLWDLGGYPVNYFRAILGMEPEEVFGWQELTESGVDLTFMGQLCFPGNIMAQFYCSFGMPFRTGLDLFGDQASLHIPLPFHPGESASMELVRGDRRDVITVPGPDPYLAEVEDLTAVILDGRHPLVTLDDSRAHIKTLLALYESARIGRPVRLAEFKG